MRNSSIALFLCAISLGSCLRKIIEENGIVSEDESNASHLFHKNAMHEQSTTNVSDLAEDAMDEKSDASVSEDAENAMDELSDASVNIDAENAMDELSDASVNEDAENAMDELSDASVNEDAENTMDELSDASVNEDAEIDTSIYQPTFEDVTEILERFRIPHLKSAEVTENMLNELQNAANDEIVQQPYGAAKAWINVVKEQVYFWIYSLLGVSMANRSAETLFLYACFWTRFVARSGGLAFKYGMHWTGNLEMTGREKMDYNKFKVPARRLLLQNSKNVKKITTSNDALELLSHM